jgi:predicted DNA-binding WGR domain protein
MTTRLLLAARKSPPSSNNLPANQSKSTPSSLAQLAIRTSAPEPPEKQEYSINYALSDRSVCRHCGLGIAKNALRIGMYVSSDSGDFHMAVCSHVECFAYGYRHSHPEAMNGILDGVESWTEIGAADVQLVAQIAGGPSAQISATEMKRLKLQNDLLACATAELRKQKPPVLATAVEMVFGKLGYVERGQGGTKKDHAVSALADAMLFGAAAPCKACKGLMVPRAEGYRCTGHVDEFTKCTEVVDVVQRHAYKHPTSVLGELPSELKAAELPIKAGPLLRPTVTGMKPGSIARPRLFESLTFAISSHVKDREQLAATIKAQGGTVVKKLPSDIPAHLARIVATSASQGSECTAPGARGFPIVTPEWVQSCINNDSTMYVPDLHTFYLANGPTEAVKTDVSKRLQKLTDAQKASTSPQNTTKVVVSAGVAVDPAVPDAHLYSVYGDNKGKPFHASMAKADLGRNQNSFYVLQILTRGRSFSVFRRWGRVGDDTKSGSVLKEHSSESSAMDEFEKVFEEKSGGNTWGTPFTKQPGAFNLIETDYTAKEVVDASSIDDKGENEKNKKSRVGDGAASSPASEALRHKETRELVARMFNKKSMEQSLELMQIDLTKLPLGNLKAETIQKGKQVLVDIQHLLRDSVNKAGTTQKRAKDSFSDPKALERQLTSLSNRFYSTIPQQFPANVDTKELLLDTPTKLAAKFDLLSDLGDIVATQRIIKDSASEADPLVACFKSLNISLAPLPNSDGNYDVLSKYFAESQGKTHRSCKLHRIWVLERAGEASRFAPWAKDKNRKLLWHGSRFTNWVGILSQGLRIAPPEAPVTGYMFGKGIYAADAVSKSANYCHLYSETGLMTLGEFALGTPIERYRSDSALSADTLPNGTHSTYAIGRTGPHDEFEWQDGIRIPAKFKDRGSDFNGSLQYNEYIIYSVAQCRLRFLLEVSQS